MLIDVQVKPKMLGTPDACGDETQEGEPVREEAWERPAGNSDRPIRDAATLEHFSPTTCRHTVHTDMKALRLYEYVGDNVYRCYLPKVTLLKFEVAPIVDLFVAASDIDCRVEMRPAGNIFILPRVGDT